MCSGVRRASKDHDKHYFEEDPARGERDGNTTRLFARSPHIFIPYDVRIPLF